MMMMMMELSEKATANHPHSFMYPPNLRVLGYTAGVHIPPQQSVQVMSPTATSPVLTTPNGGFTLPRNLIFSDAEKAAAALLWTAGTNNNSAHPNQQHQRPSTSTKVYSNSLTFPTQENSGGGGGGGGSRNISSPSAYTRQNPPTSHNCSHQESPLLGTVQSQVSVATTGNTQLMHWVSAVMAEHMHHTATVDGITYVWNGGPPPNPPTTHGEGRLSSPDSHHHNSVKSDIDPTSPHLANSIYGATRSNNSTSSLSSSSPPSSGGLIVPQPLSSGSTGNGKTSTSNGGGAGRKYQCKMCPQAGIFTSKADLQLHTQIHMREAKPYKCSQCTKAFANSSYLSQHTRIHLGIKPYRCEICQRKFTQLSHLQQHIRTHTGDKPYKCRHPGCTKAFSQLSNLQSHSRCHQTDKPYKCNSCYKCFVDEAALLDHIPKHKESKHLKTHICHYCGKSYTQETYLTKHMLKHTVKEEKKSRHSKSHSNNLNNYFSNSEATTNGNHHHHIINGTSNSGTAQAVNNNHQNNSNNNNVLSTTEIYWKADLDESSPPSMCIPAGAQGAAILVRQGSEGPDDLRVNNLGHHHHPSSHSSIPANPYDAIASAIASTKTVGASAFTPIQTVPFQTAMLQIPTNMTSNGPPVTRAYLSYDAITFQKPAHQMAGMEIKSAGTAAFPNQLISLHQIRNYAHQPSMTPEHLLGLKDTK